MRKVLIFVFLGILLALPAGAMEFEAPLPTGEAAAFLPKEADSFGEGAWNVLQAAAEVIAPSLTEGARCCLRLLGAMLLVGLVGQMGPGISARTVELAGVAAVSALLLEPSASLIRQGLETTQSLRDYGKLLLPVMTSAMAAGGGVTSASALYVGTAVFDTVLGSLVSNLMVPMLWMYLALCVACAALGEGILHKLRDLIRWAAEWALKLTLYAFTGYMAVTGAVSGTADAAAAKAARIAISGAVPVVGGILSDAADTVLLSAAALGSSAGGMGILAVLAIFCAPVLRIGCRYLLLKLTAAVGELLGGGSAAKLVCDVAGGLGLMMALVSTQAVLLLVSAVCFLRGVSG